MYPAVATRLRDEILSHVGPTRRPDYADIREMKFLRAVLNGKSVFLVSTLQCLNLLNRNDAALSCCVRTHSPSFINTCLLYLRRPFNVRYVILPNICPDSETSFLGKASTQRFGRLPTRTRSPYIFLQIRSSSLFAYVRHARTLTPCRVPYSVFIMHRRKDLWGPDGQPPHHFMIFHTIGSHYFTSR